MTDRPENVVRSEIYAVKSKILMFNACVFLACFLAWFVFSSIKKIEFTVPSAIGFVLILPVVLTREYWPLLFKSPYLKIYDNGIEIKSLGFWKWADAGCILIDGVLLFSLDLSGRNIKTSPKKTSASYFKMDDMNGKLLANYSFPIFVTNISSKEFFRVILKHSIGSKSEIVPQQLIANPKSINEAIFGKDNPSFVRVFSTISIFLFIGLIFYSMFNPSFFPSDEWKRIINPVIWIITIVGSLAYYIAYFKGIIKLRIKSNSKLYKAFCLLCVPPMIFLLSYMPFNLGVGHIYTKTFGNAADMIVTVEKVNRTKYKDCLKSSDLGVGLAQELCIRYDHINKLQKIDKLHVYGKKSWFGFVYEQYEINAIQYP